MDAESIHDFVEAYDGGDNVAIADAIDRVNSGLERFKREPEVKGGKPRN